MLQKKKGKKIKELNKKHGFCIIDATENLKNIILNR
jgi:hypothetical protein